MADASFSGELRMLPALLAMLQSSRRLRPGSLIKRELAWHGRRVDVAALSATGVLSAYELKLGSFGRLFEQALYNELSFDRSWLVTNAMPGEANVELIRRHNVGLIVVNSAARIVVAAPLRSNDSILRRRLTIKLQATGEVYV